MQLISKISYAHADDRDCSYVLYDKPDNREGSISEYVVWTESSTGDRYWGHYFPYNDDEEKNAMFHRAHGCLLYLAARKYGLTINSDESDEYFSANERDNLKTI